MGSGQTCPEMLDEEYIKSRTEKALLKFHRQFAFEGRRAGFCGTV